MKRLCRLCCIAVFSCVLAANSVAAEECRKPASLFKLVHASDAVAVVQKVGFFAKKRLIRGRQRNVMQFRFEKLIKESIRAEYDKSKLQNLIPLHSDIRLLRGERRYLVFLNYVAPNVWSAEECRYLDITDGNLVREACSAVNDLFGENRFERERRCLLNLSRAIALPDMISEIEKVIPKKTEVEGNGRIAGRFVWQPDALFQSFVFEVDSRQRKEFFGRDYVRRNVLVRGFVRSNSFDKRNLESLVREGRRISFRGTWEKGNFLIGALK